MRSFQEHLGEFDARRVRLVAISVDSPEINREHCRREGYTFTFLSDPSAQTLRDYDLLHQRAGPGGHDISRPAEFLIDAAGTVRWVNLSSSIIVRARPEQVLDLVDKLDLPEKPKSEPD